MVDAMLNSGLTVIVVLSFFYAVLALSHSADSFMVDTDKRVRKYVVGLTFILLLIAAILICPKVIAIVWSW